MKCKALRSDDPNHDVYVGPVGMWMPFHPEAYKTGRVEYLEKELNELMAQKKKNDETSKEQFKNRRVFHNQGSIRVRRDGTAIKVKSDLYEIDNDMLNPMSMSF